MSPAEQVGAVVLSLGYGVLSAVVPVANAEAYAVAVATSSVAVACSIALAAGQTAGKCALFLATRHSASRLAALLHRRREGGPRRPPGPWRRRTARAGARMLALLDRRAWAAPVVLLSASAGVPPLAVTSIAAGARRTPFLLFAVCCFAGRVARFLAVTLPAMSVLR